MAPKHGLKPPGNILDTQETVASFGVSGKYRAHGCSKPALSREVGIYPHSSLGIIAHFQTVAIKEWFGLGGTWEIIQSQTPAMDRDTFH